MMRDYRWAATGSLLFMLLACSNNAATSDLDITNGVRIASQKYSAVVKLSLYSNGQLNGNCTGTFVSSDTLLTAAHCLSGQDDDGIRIDDLGVRSLRFFIHPNATPPQVGPYDVGVVQFPPATAPDTVALSTAMPRVGDLFTIVGFGRFIEEDQSSAGTKRLGTNVLGDVTTGNMLSFAALGLPQGGGDGSAAGSGHGDSGGPLFINGTLSGTCSGGRPQGDGTNYLNYTNLVLPANQSFLRSTAANGAVLSGLDGMQALVDHNLHMALAGSDDQDDQGLVINAGPSIARLVLCASQQPFQCQAGANGYVETQLLASSKGNRFITPTLMHLTDGLVLSAVGYDGANHAVSTQVLSFKRR